MGPVCGRLEKGRKSVSAINRLKILFFEIRKNRVFSFICLVNCLFINSFFLNALGMFCHIWSLK